VFAVFQFSNLVLTVLYVGLLCLKGWALVDAVSRRPDAFVAGDKLTKPAWVIILVVALLAHLVSGSPFGILSLVGAVAAIVYLVDARPVLQSLTRR
jgi:uncharacterized membrane protein YwzB